MNSWESRAWQGQGHHRAFLSCQDVWEPEEGVSWFGGYLVASDDAVVVFGSGWCPAHEDTGIASFEHHFLRRSTGHWREDL